MWLVFSTVIWDIKFTRKSLVNHLFWSRQELLMTVSNLKCRAGEDLVPKKKKISRNIG